MDRVRIQVQYRKGIFICPDCGQEDVVDWSVSGGNTYENNCSKCGKWSNKFINHDGCLSYSQKEYKALKAEDLIAAKQARIEKHLYEIKNPPAYVEPSVKDYESMIASRMEEVNQYLSAVASKATKSELETIKSKIDSSVSSVQTSIDSKTVVNEDIK